MTLAGYLDAKEITITKMVRDLNLSYRTGWLAYHGCAVSYHTAKSIHEYTKGEISIDSMVYGKPRREFKSCRKS